MNITQYKNEILLIVSILILTFAYLFKSHTIEELESNKANNIKSALEIKEAISLKNIWEPKDIVQKIDKLKRLVSSNQLEWRKSGKKLNIKFKNMETKEFNRVLNQILTTPIQIKEIKIEQNHQKYTMELKCKY
jgi:predicted component of type VI protein secretion system